ncbi:MAG TPA: WecB/TagA/CpsF family glycosyltransferase [Melioribacteraceae bacterium]|nr:WecB/TagA/CpsF family glycosyltransferase [Melioribacteraceae bacterium]
MFEIALTSIESIPVNENSKQAFLYADFNVINKIYTDGISGNNHGLLFYPDSTAVFIAVNLLYGGGKKRIVSTDLLNKLLIESAEKKCRIFFFGNSSEVLMKMTPRLTQKYPSINICGVSNGYSFDDDTLINLINSSGTEILFVGLGAGKQEKWIVDNYSRLNCRLIVSCGGWFRYLAGTKKRAPQFLSNIYLEWLFRLLSEFRSIWKRYLFGLPLFYYRIIKGKIKLVLK